MHLGKLLSASCSTVLFHFCFRYPYIAVVLNFSQTWSLYCLVQFYNVTHERLKPIKPLAKFISFKAIVFATWWQGLGLALLSSLGVLPREGKVETALQDFLICIEVSFFCATILKIPTSMILKPLQVCCSQIFYQHISSSYNSREGLFGQ